MRSLKEVLEYTRAKRLAVGHFNFSDSTQFNAILETASELGLPVIVGVSEGEENFIKMENAVALVRAARSKGHEIYLNADHHKSVESCKKVIDAGYDSVIFDGVELTFEENIAKTREVVKYARSSGRDVIVEAELGYIGTSSKMLDEIPEDVLSASLPSVDDANKFVKETGVDALAPAVGNLHGMLKNMPNPELKIDLIENLRKALPNVHLVLHGGSGIKDEEFKKAIRAGMNCVHINTEIRKAYKDGIKEGLKDEDQIAPYRYLLPGKEKMKEVLKTRLKLFNNL